jgi:hypothetical protein
MIEETPIKFIDSKIMARPDRELVYSAFQLLMPFTFHIRWYFDICEIHLAWKTVIFDGSRKLSSFFKSSQEFFDENSIHRVLQPSYSLDIIHSDILLFGHMKTARQEYKFEEWEQLLVRIYDCLNEMQLSELMFVFHL